MKLSGSNLSEITHLEFELLHCLLQRHGQTVSPALILKEVWGYEPDDDIETIEYILDTYVQNLNPIQESQLT